MNTARVATEIQKARALLFAAERGEADLAQALGEATTILKRLLTEKPDKPIKITPAQRRVLRLVRDRQPLVVERDWTVVGELYMAEMLTLSKHENGQAYRVEGLTELGKKALLGKAAR